MMKRILTLILCLACMFIIVACGNNTGNGTTESQTDTTQVSQTANADDSNAVGDSSGDSKILIAYFAVAENSEVDAVSSASVTTINGEAKGRIRVLADMIQAETGGALFSILTSVDYPAGIGELIDYAAKEQDNNVRPELTSQIENLDNYDVIFIGYPNWWYDMPMVMYSFFETYDFTGKTIIPFNTHNGSRFSSTISTIQELEPGATVITDGFTVNDRDVENAGADITAWLDGLGY